MFFFSFFYATCQKLDTVLKLTVQNSIFPHKHVLFLTVLLFVAWHYCNRITSFQESLLKLNKQFVCVVVCRCVPVIWRAPPAGDHTRLSDSLPAFSSPSHHRLTSEELHGNKHRKTNKSKKRTVYFYLINTQPPTHRVRRRVYVT